MTSAFTVILLAPLAVIGFDVHLWLVFTKRERRVFLNLRARCVVLWAATQDHVPQNVR